MVYEKWCELVPPQLYHYHPGEQLIEMANGTTIYAMGTNKARSRLRGYNLGWACMDEVGAEPDGMVPRLIMQRIRIGNPDLRHLLMVTSPAGHRWLQDWAEQKGADGQPLVDVVRASTYDNRHLGEDYLAAMEVDFPVGTPLHLQEMMGEFVSKTGRVYGDVFDRARNLVDHSHDWNRPYDLGWDPGARASGVVAFQIFGGVHVAVREWIPDGEYTEDTATRIRQDMGRSPRSICLDTPSRLNTRTGITDVAALRAVFDRSTDVKVLGGRRRSSAYRHRAMTSALARGSLAVSRDLVRDRVGHAERGLVHALETLEWAEDSTRSERVDDKSPLKHVMDACEFYVARTIPPQFGDSVERAKAA